MSVDDGKTPGLGRLTDNSTRHQISLATPEEMKTQGIQLSENPRGHVYERRYIPNPGKN